MESGHSVLGEDMETTFTHITDIRGLRSRLPGVDDPTTFRAPGGGPDRRYARMSNPCDKITRPNNTPSEGHSETI